MRSISLTVVVSRCARAVSAHPDPLPQGEGTARIARWKANGSGCLSAASKAHPLPKGPKGEGWGEGKETSALRSVNDLDLAHGQCPQGDRGLSHSRLQASGFSGGR